MKYQKILLIHNLQMSFGKIIMIKKDEILSRGILNAYSPKAVVIDETLITLDENTEFYPNLSTIIENARQMGSTTSVLKELLNARKNNQT